MCHFVLLFVLCMCTYMYMCFVVCVCTLVLMIKNFFTVSKLCSTVPASLPCYITPSLRCPYILYHC